MLSEQEIREDGSLASDSKDMPILGLFTSLLRFDRTRSNSATGKAIAVNKRHPNQLPFHENIFVVRRSRQWSHNDGLFKAVHIA